MEWPGSLLLAASFLVIHTAVHTAPPSGISSCPIDLENLDDCILNKLNAYIPQLAKGWPEEENGLDPYLIPTAEASYLDGNLTLVLNLKDIVVTGLSSTRVNLVRAKNLVEGKLEFMCKTPKITATGIYGSEGVIISFPLHSSGPFNITLDDLTSHLVVHMKSDNDHLQITDIGLHVMPSLIYVQGGKELDDDNNLVVFFRCNYECILE